MKKYIIALAVSLLGGSLTLPAFDIKEFKDMTDLSSAAPVFSDNFNGSTTNWPLTGDWSHEPREGINGSGALRYELDNPRYTREVRRPINVKPGMSYRLTMYYRSELDEVDWRAKMEIVAIRYCDENGKELPGSLHCLVKMNSEKNDWEKVEFVFVPHPKMKTAELGLMLRRDRTGKIWFDDIVVTPYSSESATLNITGPLKLALDETGDISWKCRIDSTAKKPKELAVYATVGGRTKLVPVDANGNARASFGKFEPGKIPVEAKLLDMTGKKIIAVDRANVFVHPKEATAGPGNVEIEHDGRTLIDGKPFMPIGLFAAMIVEKKDPGALKKIRDAGFNTILSIGYVNPYGGVKDTPEETLKAMCDELQKLDLKFIFAIKHQLELPKGKKPRGRGKWGKYEGRGVIADMTVETLKNHPAMLAWYVSDENPLDEIPAIRVLRERISERDPRHPTITLTDRIINFPQFAKTGDILLHDSYPIGLNRTKTGPEQSLKNLVDAFKPAWDTGIPVWWAPQAFAWNASSATYPPRYPTEDEMTGQCLLAAINGVKAFIFYSWHLVTYLSEKNDPGHSEEQWARLQKTVATLKSLEPFIMSRETAPAVQIEKQSGNGVQARAFKCGDRICVMIVAIGPGPASADIVIPGCSGLKSRRGRTKDLGGGRYRFTGENVVYDILETNPD